MSYKIVVPFVLLLGILSFVVYSFVQPKKEVEINQALNFCGLSPKRAQELIMSQEVDQTRLFKDYGVYGDTLGFYENKYELGARDSLLGKTIYIRNICNDDEYSYLMGAELDTKIPLEQFGNGMYVVEVLNGLDRQRLVSEEALNDVFTALSFHDEAKHVELIADKDAFLIDADDAPLDDHYLFLKVDTQTLDESQYDIVLDPNGLTMFDNGNTNFGSKRKDLTEATEMYQLAQGVKSILESEGLRVKIIRDDVTPINQFGKGSRTQLAYQYKAKYYFQFNLRFSFYKPDKGMTILYSNYATNGLATSIMNQLNEHTNLVTGNFTSRNNVKGVYRSQLQGHFDARAVIRELGGQFTGAGRFEEYPTLNEGFKDSKRGMQVVSIDYGFINDDQTYDTWVNQKEAIITATADGILNGLGIKK